MITCLIVDDNDLSRLTLHQLALQTGRLRVTGECKDAIEAHRNITANPPNLVLLDVEMPGMTGLDLLKILPKQTLAILTTSQRQYAVDAFDLNVVDFLVKPVSLPRLMQAIDKVHDIMMRNDSEVTESTADYLFIKDNSILKKIRLE